MNTKNNQRTRLSKLLLKNAIMDLLKEKSSVSKISVRELCERAGLNRSTFYAHYTEPKDLLEELEAELLDSTKEYLKKIGAENDMGAQKYLISLLQYIRDNDKQFRTLLVDNADYEFRTRFMQQSFIQFVENLDIPLKKETEQYIYSYLLNGSTGVISQWMRSDYAMDVKAMSDLLFSINKNALINADKF